MGRLVVFRSLLRRRRRSLSLIPSTAIEKVEKKRAYQPLVHFWLKSMVIFTRFD
jgi:hypothetical protein